MDPTPAAFDRTPGVYPGLPPTTEIVPMSMRPPSRTRRQKFAGVGTRSFIPGTDEEMLAQMLAYRVPGRALPGALSRRQEVGEAPWVSPGVDLGISRPFELSDEERMAAGMAEMERLKMGPPPEPKSGRVKRFAGGPEEGKLLEDKITKKRGGRKDKEGVSRSE